MRRGGLKACSWHPRINDLTCTNGSRNPEHRLKMFWARGAWIRNKTTLRGLVSDRRSYCPIARVRKRDFKTANTPRGLRLGSSDVSPASSVSVSPDELSVGEAVPGVPPAFPFCIFV